MRDLVLSETFDGQTVAHPKDEPENWFAVDPDSSGWREDVAQRMEKIRDLHLWQRGDG